MTINHYSLMSLCFFALALLIKSMPFLDIELLKFFNSLMFSELFFSYFTEIGNGLVCLAIIIPVLSYFSHKTSLNSVKTQTLVMVGLIIGAIVKVLKELASFSVRPGYYQLEDINYLEPVFSYNSFPSGHAATIIGISFVWISLAFRGITAKHAGLIISLVIFLALSVSLSRVIVAAHWLSDVLGSIAIAFLVLNVVELKFLKNVLYSSNLSRYASFFLIGLAWFYILSQGTIY